MVDVDSIVDNILLNHAAENSKCARRSAAVDEELCIIVPFLITAVLVAVAFVIASI